MDIKEDENTPIILGRPFLATTRDIIDVKRGRLTFEVGEEKVEFILTQFLQALAIEDTCYIIDVIDECEREMESGEEIYSDIIKISTPQIRGDDDWCPEYQDNNLRECLALTPNHMPFPKRPDLELKTLPKNLRYKFLDTELK